MWVHLTSEVPAMATPCISREPYALPLRLGCDRCGRKDGTEAKTSRERYCLYKPLIGQTQDMKEKDERTMTKRRAGVGKPPTCVQMAPTILGSQHRKQDKVLESFDSMVRCIDRNNA